jgi:hypothetical protein
MPKLTLAKYIEHHRVFIRFDDGAEGVVDFLPRLRDQAGIGRDLLSTSLFENFRIDHDWNTLVWNNGWDVAPDVLYQLVCVPQHAT